MRRSSRQSVLRLKESLLRGHAEFPLLSCVHLHGTKLVGYPEFLDPFVFRFTVGSLDVVAQQMIVGLIQLRLLKVLNGGIAEPPRPFHIQRLGLAKLILHKDRSKTVPV